MLSYNTAGIETVTIGQRKGVITHTSAPGTDSVTVRGGA